MGDIGKAIAAMRWAADSDQVGYSQSDRWGVEFFGAGRYNADCSSLVIQALRHAGYDTGGATYTGNMSAELCARGWSRVPADGHPRRGDVLLNDASHVAMWLGDCLAQASIDENGNIAGGARGDQTGAEVNTRGYYDYPWDCYLRPPAAQPEGDEVKAIDNAGGDVFRLYNPHTGFHHFTKDASERDYLKRAGWRYEGVAWRAPRGGVLPVFRMYNPNNGDHMLTTGFAEAQSAQKAGWAYEGAPFFANPTGKQVHRLYNPHSGEHFYTADAKERDSLVKLGWKAEGGFCV